MKKHRLNIYPEMKDEDYDILLGELKQNGYDKDLPIILYEGEILDGWNRYKACSELDIEPTYKDFEGDENEAFAYVLKTNKRRNLTSSQKAAVAVMADDVWRLIEKKVEEERREKISLNNKNQYTKESATCQKIDTSQKPERTSQKIADVFDTNRQYVSDAKKYKEQNPDIFEQILSGEKQIPEVKKEQKEVQKKQKKEQSIKLFEEASEKFKDDDIQIFFDEFQKGCERIEDNSVDAIITDPPYPVEFMHLWEDMFRIADRILKPSAFLITYANHQNLDKIFQLPNPLKYYWIFKLDFTAKPIAMGRNLIATWKPVLVYQKLPFKKIEETIEDVVKETKDFKYEERDYHDLNWGQSLGKFEYLIDKFTKPNDLIIEPFAGTGTTLVAAKNMKRRCIGFEIEKDKYESIIKGRIVEGV